MTPIPLRPGGVERATMVSIPDTLKIEKPRKIL
jgi:hypothetical protein